MEPSGSSPGRIGTSIRRRLGSGSFGVVYEGWDRVQEASVALKWLSYVDAETIHRFKNEFRSLAEISHPSLVQLYDLACEGDRWFFTMELIDGASLPEHLRPDELPPGLDTMRARGTETSRASISKDTRIRAPRRARAPIDVDQDEIVRVFSQLAQGVQALHEAGKLHRDLKCQNVLVTPERRAVLLDFGLVREVDPARSTDDVDIAGTPLYMAPEQCAGTLSGPPADWYALGVMLFRALTGRFPFEGRMFEVMARKQTGEAERPSAFVEGVRDDLDTLCAGLLTRTPDARPSGSDILAALGISGGPTVAYPPRPAEIFVGRRSELRAIEQARASVRRTGPLAVYVHGMSGIGKTSLVHSFLARARSGASGGPLILEGRCFERETLPYKALDRVIDSLVTHLRRLPPKRCEELVPEQVGDLVRAFPALSRVPTFEKAARPSSDVPDPQEQRRRAIEGLGGLLRRLSKDREVIVFIDDLQWGDRDSATVVARLLEVQDAPVLWLGTFRSDEAASSPYLTYLGVPAVKNERTVTLQLRELAEEDARALLAARLSARSRDDRLVTRLAREAGGSPLFIDLLVRRARDPEAAAEEGLDLAGIIRERMEELAPEARRLLEVLAVRGRPLDATLAATVTGVSSLDVTALTQLRNSRLLRIREGEEGQELELYHDRIRETLGGQLSDAHERELHAKLAQTIRDRGDADPEALAYHYRGAGQLTEAFRFTVDAARRAEKALAFERAADLYRVGSELASQLPTVPQVTPPIDRVGLRTAEGDALRNAGRGAEAARAYLDAASASPRRRALSMRRLAGEQYLLSGHHEEGRAVLDSVLREVGMSMPEHPARILAEFVMRRIQVRMRGLRFRERPADSLSEDQRLAIDTCWAAAGGLALIDPVRGGIFQARHLLLALDAGELSRITRAIAVEIPFSATGGARNRSRTAELERLGLELAQRTGHDYTYGLLYETSGGAAWLEGRWKAALELEERGITLHRTRCSGVAWETTSGTIVLCEVLWRMGRWPELFERYPAFLADAVSRGDLLLELHLRIKFRAASQLAADRPDEAMREAREALARWSQSEFTLLHFWELFVAVESELYADRPWDARDWLARTWGTLRRSQLLRLEMYSVTMHDLVGRVALACAAGAGGRERARLLGRAELAAKRVERNGAVWGRGLSSMLRAGVSAAEGRHRVARRRFQRAEEELRTSDMELHAQIARARRAQLEGRDQERQEVVDWIGETGVARPERWLEILAPGHY